MAIARSIPEIILHQNDTRPVITATLYNSETGGVWDLTGATAAHCYIMLEGATTNVNAGSESATILSTTGGQVSYTIPSTATLSDAGNYTAQFKITWAGSNYQHTSKFRIRVEQSLG